MRAFLLAGIGVALAVLVAGCGRGDQPTSTTSTSEAAGLAGRAFVSSSVTEGGTPRPLAGPQPIGLSFEDGRLAAHPGCNSLGGSYRVDDGRLRVGDLATTEMACERPELMEQDRWFAELLLAGPTISLTATELTMTSGDTTIVFTDREIAEPDRPLAGSWTLDGIVEGELASSAPAGVDATITITDDRTIRWHASCNAAQASIATTGSAITIGEAQSIASDCQPPPPEIAAAAADLFSTISETLDGTVTYEIDGSRLSITKGGRTLQLRSS